MGSILGFTVAGALGALTFFIATLIIAVYVKLETRKENLSTKVVRFLLGEKEIYPSFEVYRY